MPPTLVLLPGMDGTGRLFASLIQALGPDQPVQVVDYPPEQVLGYDELVVLVRSQLPDRPFILLGESFSGPIAVRIAADPPAGLRGVILVASFVCSPSQLLSWSGPMVGLLPLGTGGVHLWVASRLLLGRWDGPVLRGALGDALAPVLPRVLRSRLRAIAGVDVRRELAAVPVPLVYLRADEDQVVSAQALVSVQQIRPDVRVLSLPGPHLVLQALPDLSAVMIQGFLNAI